MSSMFKFLISLQDYYVILTIVALLIWPLKKLIVISFRLLGLLKLLIDVKSCSKLVKEEMKWSFLTDWKSRVDRTPHLPFLRLVEKNGNIDINEANNDEGANEHFINPTILTFLEADILSDKIADVFYHLLMPESSNHDGNNSRKDSSHSPLSSPSSPPVVAVLLPSSPFYVTCYIGLIKAGASGGLINTNLRGKQLAHAIRVSLEETYKKSVYPCTLLIQEEILLDRLSDPDVKQVLDDFHVKIVVKNGSLPSKSNENPKASKLHSYQRIDTLIQLSSHTNTSAQRKTHHIPKWNSTFCYIFTSGTTGGLAKASVIKHIRFRLSGLFFSITARLSPSDRIYCALPLYHSAAASIGVSGCILSGACLCIRPKFSASEFANDLVRYKCTVVQYIGEFARYTLSSAVDNAIKAETILRNKQKQFQILRWLSSLLRSQWQHDSEWNGVRLAFGNGMSPDVWKPFQNRFGIRDIVEFYASTEGNANIVNNCSIVGCIGVVPFFISSLYPIYLAKCDPITGEIMRDPETNLAIPCKANEIGQMLGRITKNSCMSSSSQIIDPARMFDGYTDKVASQKKIVLNIEHKNDQWFATGDLMKRDWFGFYFWVDRIGDTFRWKGENVSTCEVAAAFASDGGVDNISEVNVYGVEVPGYPGRAGMARITLKETTKVADIFLSKLYLQLSIQLAPYAQPLFLRVANSDGHDPSMTTPTFKQIKGILRDQGFDPFFCGGEDVYIRDDKEKTYRILTKMIYDDICSLKLRI